MRAEDVIKPAGGAEIDQIVLFSAVVIAGLLVLLWQGLGARAGRRNMLVRVAGFAAARTDLPRWAALPLILHFGGCVVAFLGFYWDATLHADNGRDSGPFANPSHYPMMLGLYGVLIAGMMGLFLVDGTERPGRAPFRITRTWHVHRASLMTAAAGGIAFTAFPVDDFWHRLFGQDVTLWGPTHLMMLTGIAFSVVPLALMFVDAVPERWRPLPGLLRPLYSVERLAGVPYRFVVLAIAAAWTVATLPFLTEFDFGAPQFQLSFQPLIIALGAGASLVAARIWFGAGGALQAAVLFVVVRFTLALLIHDVAGEVWLTFPLLIVEALCVELVFALRGTNRLAAGAASGVLIGTVGFAGEWWWSQEFLHTAWTTPILPYALIGATVTGVAGGLVGALIGIALAREPFPPTRVARPIAIGSLVAVWAVFVPLLLVDGPDGQRATVTIEEVGSAADREVVVTVDLDPSDLGDGATWVRAVAWQGGEPLISEPMTDLGNGTFRSVPLPVDGEWKVAIRVAKDSTMIAIPIYAPADPAVPVPAVEVPETGSVVDFVTERYFLQRETKVGVPAGTWAGAMVVVAMLELGFLTVLGVGLAQIGRAAREESPVDAPERVSA